jgi:hypothetical protein
MAAYKDAAPRGLQRRCHQDTACQKKTPKICACCRLHLPFAYPHFPVFVQEERVLKFAKARVIKIKPRLDLSQLAVYGVAAYGMQYWYITVKGMSMPSTWQAYKIS